MAQLNRHYDEIDSFYGDFFKSLWLIPYNLSSLTKVIEYLSIWEIDDYKNKIRPSSIYVVDCSSLKEIRGGSLCGLPVALICISY